MTGDHFLPIFFALGAAGDDLQARYLSREVMYGMLSMDAFALEPVGATVDAVAGGWVPALARIRQWRLPTMLRQLAA